MNRIELLLLDELHPFIEEEKAIFYPRFFKAYEGGYGEGDKFIGVRACYINEIAKKNIALSLKDLECLINSEIHEIRRVALIILCIKYKKTKIREERKKIVTFYLNNTNGINNWDLVDCSAPKIIGEYLTDYAEPLKLLKELALSENIWEQRIGIVSCLSFIRLKRYKEPLEILQLKLLVTEDILQKAVGWMLREISKRDMKVTFNFIEKNYNYISRTSLRCAIELFPKEDRQNILKGALEKVIIHNS
ncbi:MAG: DNA alkylation repair protein [Bacteroidales bacterium]